MSLRLRRFPADLAGVVSGQPVGYIWLSPAGARSQGQEEERDE
jgi:hypothetical protein